MPVRARLRWGPAALVAVVAGLASAALTYGLVG
jgi:hypothetical protein